MTPSTLRALFDGALERFANAPALVVDGRRVRYAELIADSNRLAHRLLSLGVTRGSRVALVMSNRVEYVIADQAVLRCGAVKVPLNDMLSEADIAYALRDCRAAVAITDSGTLPAVMRAGSLALSEIITVGQGIPDGVLAWREALADQPTTTPMVAIAPADLGLIMYTGGTTGKPKGVMHTQQNLARNLLSHIIEMELQDDDKLLLTTPLPHSAGFLLQAALLKGLEIHLEPRFDPEAVVDKIIHDRITYTFMVPTMIYRLLDRTAGRQLDRTALRTILYGAAPITRDRLEQGLRQFGSVFVQLYGQSEAPNFITRLTRGDHRLDHPYVDRLTSCGRPTRGSRVRIIDDDGNDVPTGQPGEVIAHTPYTMVGYLGNPDATAHTLRDGWLHTGDIGRLDSDGYLYLLDRKNDMVITGGMNVYCSEVENAIQNAPGIDQVAVVGIPHLDWGEAVVAFVVPDNRHAAIEDEVLDACRDLARYKRPKAVRVLPQLPTTAFGKVDKKALRTSWPGW